MKHSRISSTQNLCIDIGSGYNPAKGYKTADITEFPNLDYIIKNNILCYNLTVIKTKPYFC